MLFRSAYVGLNTFTLQKIGKAWRDHKCKLKTTHYILHPRNKAQVKSNRPKGCIPEDWDVLINHWYTEDAVVCSFFFFRMCLICVFGFHYCYVVNVMVISN